MFVSDGSTREFSPFTSFANFRLVRSPKTTGSRPWSSKFMPTPSFSVVSRMLVLRAKSSSRLKTVAAHPSGVQTFSREMTPELLSERKEGSKRKSMGLLWAVSKASATSVISAA